MAKKPVSLSKSEVIMHSGNNINTRNKTCWKSWYELLKSIFITVEIIRISSDRSVLSWVYNNCKSFLSVETDDSILAIENIICFETLT